MDLDVAGIGSVAHLFDDAIDKIWPDPKAAAQARVALLEARQKGALAELDAHLQLQLAQIKANAAEAALPGMHFRDGAGWVCVIGFALTLLRAPIEWACQLAGHPVALPTIDSATSNDMLYGLLGLGTMHVVQKVKGAK